MTKPLILCSLILILLGTLCPQPSAAPAAPVDALMTGMTYYVAPTGDNDYLGTLTYP